MKCKYHKTPKNQNPEFKDCSETGLPCPHTGIMPYQEIENDEINWLCFFAEEILERQKIGD